MIRFLFGRRHDGNGELRSRTARRREPLSPFGASFNALRPLIS